MHKLERIHYTPIHFNGGKCFECGTKAFVLRFMANNCLLFCFLEDVPTTKCTIDPKESYFDESIELVENSFHSKDCFVKGLNVKSQ